MSSLLLDQRLLKQNKIVIEFLTYYKSNNKDIEVFSKLPFKYQLGTFIMFLDTKDLVVNADTCCFCVALSKPINIPLLMNNKGYYITELNDTTLNNYKEAIIFAFSLLNNFIPF